MKKILIIDPYEHVVFDLELNSVSCIRRYHPASVLIIDEDMQIITPDEVIDVKEGDIVMTHYSKGSNEGSNVKITVVHDRCAFDDFKCLNKREND